MHSIFVHAKEMRNIQELINNLHKGDKKALARCISIVENEAEGYDTILTQLKLDKKVPVIGITGPPGAGKSTLLNVILRNLLGKNNSIGVVAIDPTSPFNFGSLLGDRLRMSEHFNDPEIYIRSLATRGSLGGLSAKAMEVVDVMRAAGFDYIFVETVGVGQSEVEVVGLADTVILVLVPESGDEIQVIKSGIMEIADIFVVNKSDREGASAFVNNLQLHIDSYKDKEWKPPIIKTIATEGVGIDEILQNINLHAKSSDTNSKAYFLSEKAYRIIQNYKMRKVDKQMLQNDIQNALSDKEFNIYQFTKEWIEKNA